MSARLEPSGERLIEEHYRATLGGYVIYLMHIASYGLAEPYCRGKRVLDLGCGSGYGAARIAAIAALVQAVDIAADAIAYAQTNYSCSNVSFAQIKADSPLPFGDRTFDVVLSFQVIEHVADDHAYLREAARVLDRDGLLILITPDRARRLLPTQKPWNRWHLREYDGKSLRALVEEEFSVQGDLRMGARADVANVELRRYRRLKWLTLPFTLPFVPETWRRWGLDALHRMRGQTGQRHEVGVKQIDYGFGVEAIEFAPTLAKSLNLVMIATPRPHSQTPQIPVQT